MGWFDQQAQQMPQQSGSLAALGGGVGRNAPIYNPVQPPQSGPQPVPGMLPQPMRDLMPGGGQAGTPGFDAPWPNTGFPGGGGFWNPPPNMRPIADNGNGGPMTQQDYDNTVKRYNELLPESQKYFRDFGPPDPNDPTRNEMNILAGRMAAWQAMPGNAPVYQPNGPIFGGGKDSTGMPLISGDQGNRGSGQPINQPMGSLQALGGGPIAATVGNALNGVGSQPNMGGPIGATVSNALNQSGMVNLRGPDGSMKAIPQSDLAHWLSKGATMAMGG
jgi:hypothetical protein